MKASGLRQTKQYPTDPFATCASRAEGVWCALFLCSLVGDRRGQCRLLSRYPGDRRVQSALWLWSPNAGGRPLGYRPDVDAFGEEIATPFTTATLTGGHRGEIAAQC